MKKFLSLLLTGVMSAMLLAGCGTTANDPDPASSSTPPTGEEERSITIAQSANFSMGFAPGVQSYEATYYMNNFYESLVEYRDGEYLPCLATDWAASDDGLTYTFHLRDDVQFNDGTAFNAEAVKLTTEITVDDEYTVSFHLSRPYYNVLNDLSMVMPRGILSAAAFHEDGSLNTEYLMTHTPGTGPYMFESVNETATEYTFVKNPNYWGEDPDVDRFIVKVIPESKVAAMRAGEVDFIMGSDTLDANSYLELSQVEGITGVISDFDFVTEFIALNDEVAPLDDLNVRTAIQMAIDKESIAQNIYSGLRTKADSVMPAAMPYCVATVSTPDYDMDGAIALLEGSGWVDSNGDGIREKDGQALSLKYTYDSGDALNKSLATAVKSQLAAVGINVETEGQEMMTWWQEGVAGNYDLIMWNTEQPYTSPHNYFIPMLSRSPHVPSLPAVEGSDEFLALIEEFQTTDDSARVQEIFDELLNFDNDNVLDLPLLFVKDMIVYNTDKIAGYDFSSTPVFFDARLIQPAE